MRSKHTDLPIFRKAIEIGEITRALIEAIDERADRFMLRKQMLENASLIGAKVAGAEGAGIYRVRMENAVLIKMAACELESLTSLCKVEAIAKNDYLALLREAIAEFKHLFIEWIASFDRSNNIDDGWGLFAD